MNGTHVLIVTSAPVGADQTGTLDVTSILDAKMLDYVPSHLDDLPSYVKKQLRCVIVASHNVERQVAVYDALGYVVEQVV